jgi:hypothetical protein
MVAPQAALRMQPGSKAACENKEMEAFRMVQKIPMIVVAFATTIVIFARMCPGSDIGREKRWPQGIWLADL